MLQIKRSELKQLAQNKLGNDSIESQNKILVMISTALAARTSYTVVGDEKEVLKSSEEWQKLYPEIKVLDPDGWDREDFDKSWNQLISFEEYNSRLSLSTCKGINNFPLKNKHNSTKIDYQKMIELHDRLLTQNPPHSSPFEHCAKVMDEIEYVNCIRTDYNAITDVVKIIHGISGNFQGFIQYRKMFNNKNITG